MAKFKVGDRVKLVFGGVQRAKVLREVAPMHGEVRYLIKWEDGDEDTFLESELVAANSCVRNAAPDGWWVGKKVYAAFGWGKSVKGKVIYHKNGVIKLEDGTTFKGSDAYDLYVVNSIRTTNAVVAKALNAKALNATWDASVVRRMLDEGRRLASSGSAAAKKKWSDEMYRQTLSHGGEIPRELDLLWSSPAFAAYARDPDEF